MTQIIAVLTQEYVLVASDRQLTYIDGPSRGRVADDSTCKLVLLCGLWGIAYTGLGKLNGIPTHEWIALRLANANCHDADSAAQVIVREAGCAIKALTITLELTFLICGWRRGADGEHQPHFILVTNAHGDHGERLVTATRTFRVFERRLEGNELYAARVIGQPLRPGRGKRLHRTFRRVVEHKTTPKPAMLTFVEEIAYTSARHIGVGKKVLAFSIPRAAAGRAYAGGGSLMFAGEPNTKNIAFCYFDPMYSQIEQFGPTFVCGDAAVTDIRTENDTLRGHQSSGYRILHVPKYGRLPDLVVRADGDRC